MHAPGYTYPHLPWAMSQGYGGYDYKGVNKTDPLLALWKLIWKRMVGQLFLEEAESHARVLGQQIPGLAGCGWGRQPR